MFPLPAGCAARRQAEHVQKNRRAAIQVQSMSLLPCFQCVKVRLIAVRFFPRKMLSLGLVLTTQHTCSVVNRRMNFVLLLNV